MPYTEVRYSPLHYLLLVESIAPSYVASFEKNWSEDTVVTLQN